ncbi:c-type cytochrome [Thalassococcus sp. BH17M4-6]|uniref:c-type cytochrome n=1 Tax=Thalassococcus sp. BH17M4-6 TaxID=3413148 RepID=UPI003BBDAC9D
MRNKAILAAAALVAMPVGGLAEALVVPPGLLTMEGDPEYGEYLGGECTTCHQLEAYDGIPPLAGLDKEHFILAMLEYRQKLRENAAMQLVAGRLSDEEIAALAAYFKELE